MGWETASLGRSMVAVLIVAAVAGGACGDDGGPAAATEAPPPPPPSSGSTTTSLPPTELAASEPPATTQALTGPGRYELTLEVGGDDRHCSLVIPSSYDRAVPVPLVIGYHGWGGDADSIIDGVQRWGDVAEDHGFVLAAPQGLPGTFFGAEGGEWAVLHDEGELAAFAGDPAYQAERVYEYFLDELGEFSVGPAT